MKWINKTLKEPKCLTEYRATPNATYSGLQSVCKDEIRRRLLNEQGHLCAYCMQRISLEYQSDHNKIATEIEHFKAQASDESLTNESLTLDFRNMLAVCNGYTVEKEQDKRGEDKEKKYAHCDKTVGGKQDGRKNLRVLDPRLPRCEELIKYSTSGKIEAVNDHPDVTFDLETMLNLNIERLVNNRKEILDKAAERLRNALPKNLAKPISKSILEAEIDYWGKPKIKKGEDGKHYVYFKPFCQVAVWYLKKKLRKSL
jgi:uncharacterized protein (TIGR02646 family)